MRVIIGGAIVLIDTIQASCFIRLLTMLRTVRLVPLRNAAAFPASWVLRKPDSWNSKCGTVVYGLYTISQSFYESVTGVGLCLST